MENTKPRRNPHLCWTRGSLDDPEPTPAANEPPAAPALLPSVLETAQRILAALLPFPEAYQAVQAALAPWSPLAPIPAGP